MLIVTRWILGKMVVQEVGNDTAGLGGGGGLVGLLTTNLSPTPQTTLGDCTAGEASYSGYHRQNAIFDPDVVFADPNDVYGVQAGSLAFSPTTTMTPQTITGYFIVGGDSVNLVGVEMFDSPVPLVDPSTVLTLIPRFGMPESQAFGFAIVAP